MDMRKNGMIVIVIILILFSSTLILLFNLTNVSFDEKYHRALFTKHGVYYTLSEYEIEEIHSDVIDHLKNGKDELIQNDFFNAREKAHLRDVKDVMQVIVSLRSILLVLMVGLLATLWFLDKSLINISKKIGIVMLSSGILNVIIFIILAFVVGSNFQFLFDSMHQGFFSEGTYVFDPEAENIVNLYPFDFFKDTSMRILVQTLFFSGFILFNGLFIILYFRKDKDLYKLYS